MKLLLDRSLGEGYPSMSQWARRVTEGWAADNLVRSAHQKKFGSKFRPSISCGI